MISRSLMVFAALAACLSAMPLKAALPEHALAWHWQVDTAERARRATLALNVWLEDPEADPTQWRQRVESTMLILADLAETVPPSQAALADGLFAWLVHARDRNLQTLSVELPLPDLSRAGDLLERSNRAGRAARLYSVAALQAPVIWERLSDRMADNEALDPEDEIEAFWSTLMAPDPDALPAAPESAALAQADRVARLARLEGSSARSELLVELTRFEAERAWLRADGLGAVWLALEALARTTALEDPAPAANSIDALLEQISGDSGRSLRQIDTDLPVILAMLQDAAGHLAEPEPGVSAALSELADAYARLALFAGDAAFYLEQPVREDIRSAISACNADPLLVGPLPRETFERCLETLVRLMTSELGREELVGDGDGPYAPTFLRREMGLVSWQRAAYLDGHLNWLLGNSCPVPQWQNPLEWSLLVQYLSRWVAQRPVFFDSARWRDAVDVFVRQSIALRESPETFLDCLTGTGSMRRDPVQQLLSAHGTALADLNGALTSESDRYYAEVTRAAADIDLDGDASQLTAYRPEGLSVGPCPEAQACGVRAELPVSRALLGQFPNAYLLADQIRMGQLDMCYDAVRWVEREMEPARNNDSRVANYRGRLSFELVGSFERNGVAETVFRQRLTATESRHYLFASSEPTVLEMDCPNALAGEPVASRLPENRPGLVPNRLTYFVSQPVTAEAEMLANWDSGAEWRDWFVTGGRVEMIETSDGTALAVAVQAELASLVSRRERLLASRLLSPLTTDQADPLTNAMAVVAENSALLRRILEIHYPRVIRHDNDIRALLSGENSLLSRDRVRQIGDGGRPLRQTATIGRERLDALVTSWAGLPASVREFGQSSPELDFAAERLESLRRLSRSWLEDAESSPDP